LVLVLPWFLLLVPRLGVLGWSWFLLLVCLALEITVVPAANLSRADD